MKSGAKAMKKEFKKIDVGDVEVSQETPVPFTILCSTFHSPFALTLCTM